MAILCHAQGDTCDDCADADKRGGKSASAKTAPHADISNNIGGDDDVSADGRNDDDENVAFLQ